MRALCRPEGEGNGSPLGLGCGAVRRRRRCGRLCAGRSSVFWRLAADLRLCGRARSHKYATILHRVPACCHTGMGVHGAVHGLLSRGLPRSMTLQGTPPPPPPLRKHGRSQGKRWSDRVLIRQGRAYARPPAVLWRVGIHYNNIHRK